MESKTLELGQREYLFSVLDNEKLSSLCIINSWYCCFENEKQDLFITDNP